MDPISCDFFLKVRFKYLETRYWTYWIVSCKCCIVGPDFMDQISCGFFSKVGFKYLDTKYFIPRTYLMDKISCDFPTNFKQDGPF